MARELMESGEVTKIEIRECIKFLTLAVTGLL